MKPVLYSLTPQPSGNHALLMPFLRKIGLLFLSFFLFSITVFGHSVTGYTAACNTGPKYSLDATVTNVTSTSNYAWQYKNASNAWICILNGNNVINGNTYSVSGATSTATLNPSPIVFNNPNSGLQGLIIRCVISDGAGVNPCSLPSGNTWNGDGSSVNFTINVTGTPCATGSLLSLGNRVWYDANGNGTNDSEDGIANAALNLYKDNNNDNVADGAAIATTTTDDNGYYLFVNLAAGNYIVGVVTPAGYVSSPVNGGDPDDNTNLDDNGQVTVGNETRGLAITLAPGTEPDGNNTNTNTNITYDFGFLPDCSCTTSAGNLLVNGSFENGTTGWSWSNGTLTTGTGYIACGNANGFNNWSSGTAKVWQDVNILAGATVTFSAYAGTHTPGLACAPTLSLIFLNSSNGVTGQSNVVVTRDVDANFNQLEYYTITAVAPAGTVKARVQSAITCNTMKLDAFCLTAINPTTLSLGDRMFYDANGNGYRDDAENGIANLTVRLYKDNNNDNVPDGAAIDTKITDADGFYSFTGLAAGNYIVGVVTPAGYVRSPVNGGDPDNNIDRDNNGSLSAGTETRGSAITLSPGTEPDGTNTNTNNNITYDFGFLPDCSCTNSAGNRLVNGSFENGTTGWSASGGTLTTGTGFIACGNANGFNNWSSGTAKVWQDVSVTPGSTVTFSGYAGTHTPGLTCSPTLSLIFLNSSNVVISQSNVPVTRDVDVNDNQLEYYSITVASAPAGTTKVRVQSSITCNVMKLDALCLRITSGGVLPVQLLSFTATKQTTNVLLNWQTATELGTNYFDVQYSKNGTDWVNLGRVNAAGNSNSLHSYSFTHLLPAKGANYYNLKIADNSGQYAYSPVRVLVYDAKGGITIFPNPIIDKVYVTSATSVQIESISLFDAQGKVMHQLSNFISGSSIDMSMYSKGTYMLKITDKMGNTETKVLIKR